jgi:hypothetical protein
MHGRWQKPIGTVTVRDNPAPNTNGYWPRNVAATIGVDVPVDFSATTSGGVSATISVPGTAGMTPTSSSTSGTVTTFHFDIPSSVQAANSEGPVEWRRPSTSMTIEGRGLRCYSLRLHSLWVNASTFSQRAHELAPQGRLGIVATRPRWLPLGGPAPEDRVSPTNAKAASSGGFFEDSRPSFSGDPPAGDKVATNPCRVTPGEAVCGGATLSAGTAIRLMPSRRSPRSTRE